MQRTRWQAPVWNRSCPLCGARLLKGESNDWCCNRGKNRAPPLPLLPRNVTAALEDSELSKDISAISRRLNNLFCFTAIGATGGFTHFATGSATVSITGRTYHRLYDVSDAQHCLHWFLYDGFERVHQGLQYDVPTDWTHALRTDLDDVNPYVRHLQQFHEVPGTNPCALELTDVSADGDFAAIMHASNTTSIKPRGILIWNRSSAQPTFMPIFSRHYEPLQYPLLFPHGTPGWGLNTTTQNTTRAVPFTQRVWYKSRLLTEDRFQMLGRLGCEYLCDMYSRIKEERLGFIRRGLLNGQTREENDEEDDNSTDLELPASFLGSRKWASEQTADSLALARTYRKPSFFITMTCNPKWPEIQSRLCPRQNACDIPVIIARIFKLRQERLLQLLKTKFGTLVYVVKVIEFQKRGWPHVHIVCKVNCLCFHL